jgi:hypothetical protein
LEDRTESIEEPSVGVDLVLVLFFEAKYYLNGHDSLVRSLKLEGRSDGNLSGIFVDVSRDVLGLDASLGDARLIDTHGSEDC